MFNANDKAKEQDLKRKMERSEREQFLQMEEKKIGLLEKLTILVEQKLVEEKENEIEKTKYTINGSAQFFETKGFSFNTFIVSEVNKDTILVIEYDLEKFEMVLTSGFNRLNLPNGCLLQTKDAQSITLSLILSKQRF